MCLKVIVDNYMLLSSISLPYHWLFHCIVSLAYPFDRILHYLHTQKEDMIAVAIHIMCYFSLFPLSSD